MASAVRPLSRYPQYVLEALYLRTMFLEGSGSLHGQIGFELEWRQAQRGKPAAEGLQPPGVTPSQPGLELAHDWTQMRDAGERWIPIWSGDNLTLRLGSTLLLLQSITRGRLECHIPIARARLTFSVRASTATLDWDGGSLELDRPTGEALVVFGVPSIDARVIEEALAEMLAHQALTQALRSAVRPQE